MDYEKKYKNALEWARQVMSGETGFIRKEVEEVFPELKKSEDEVIRKAIISFLCSKNGYMNPDEDWDFHNRWLPWLEKQGSQILANSAKTCKNEQEPTDKLEPKFKVGDWVIISTSDGEEVVQIDSIGYFKCGEPRYITSEGRRFGNGTKARLLTDVEISTIAGSKAIKSKSWSEEDDERLESCLAILRPRVYGKTETLNTKWLKSLKGRYTWKPSDEQMDVLLSEVTAWTKGCSKQKVLESLYNDLKKLRKE